MSTGHAVAMYAVIFQGSPQKELNERQLWNMAPEDYPPELQCVLGLVAKSKTVWRGLKNQPLYFSNGGYKVKKSNRHVLDEAKFAIYEECTTSTTVMGTRVNPKSRALLDDNDDDEKSTRIKAIVAKCYTPGGVVTPCSGKVGKFVSGNPHSLPPSCLTASATSCSFYNNCLEKTKPCGQDGFALGYGAPFCQKMSSTNGGITAKFDSAGAQWLDGVVTCQQRTIIQSGLLESEGPTHTCNAIKTESLRLSQQCFISNGFCDVVWANIVPLHDVVHAQNTMFDTVAWTQICDAMAMCASADQKIASIFGVFTEKCPAVARPAGGNSESFSVLPNGLRLKQLQDTPWGAFDINEYADPFRDDWVAPVLDACDPKECCTKTCSLAEDPLPTRSIAKYFNAGDFMSQHPYELESKKGMITYKDGHSTSTRNQFFRLDSRMVECADAIQEEYLQLRTESDQLQERFRIKIRDGYRTATEARLRWESEPETETLPSRFQTGAALRLEYAYDSAAVVVDADADMNLDTDAVCLVASVGLGGRNTASDLLVVRTRLQELGFHLGGVLHWQIKLFQCMTTTSCTSPTSMTGSVVKGDDTHKWLQATNAPEWKMIAGRRIAVSFEPRPELTFGSSWLEESLELAGLEFFQQVKGNGLFVNFQEQIGMAKMIVGDISMSSGGKAFPHRDHHVGMAADVKPMRVPGQPASKLPEGTKAWNDPQYSRDLTRKLLVALAKQPLVEFVYYNDPVLLLENLSPKLKIGTPTCMKGSCTANKRYDHNIGVFVTAPAREGVADACKGASSAGSAAEQEAVADSYVEMGKIAARVCYPIFAEFGRIIALGLGKDSLQVELRAPGAPAAAATSVDEAATLCAQRHARGQCWNKQAIACSAPFEPGLCPGDANMACCPTGQELGDSSTAYIAWADQGAELSSKDFSAVIAKELQRVGSNMDRPNQGRVPPQRPNPEYQHEFAASRRRRTLDDLTLSVKRVMCGTQPCPSHTTVVARANSTIILHRAVSNGDELDYGRLYAYNPLTWDSVERLQSVANMTSALMGVETVAGAGSVRHRRQSCADAAVSGFLRVSTDTNAQLPVELSCEQVASLGLCTSGDNTEGARTVCPVSCGACGSTGTSDLLNPDDSFCFRVLQGGGGAADGKAQYGIVDAYAELYEKLSAIYASGKFKKIPHKPWVDTAGAVDHHHFAFGKTGPTRDDVENALFRCFLPCDDKGNWFKELASKFATKKKRASSAWYIKLEACENFLHWVAPDPSLWGNLDSAVHIAARENNRMRDNARFWGQVVEETPLYSIVVPYFEKSFVDVDGDEVRFHDERLNPSPIYDVFQRLYAMVGTGKITFWISHASEVLGLRNLLMIAIGYNPLVTVVEIRAPESRMAEVKIQTYEWLDVFADTLYKTKRKELAQLSFVSIGAADMVPPDNLAAPKADRPQP